jgi:hypothetical protein
LLTTFPLLKSLHPTITKSNLFYTRPSIIEMAAQQPNAVNGTPLPGSWQEKLNDHCKNAQMRPPVWNILSDRRGGRTAWSSTVMVEGLTHPARYWYDGRYVENAKDDAAEVALQRMGVVQAPTSPQSPGQQWQGVITA